MNAGLICNAADHAKIKNLRLYNADITGDWNIGGIVGFYKGSGLTIENCRIVNSVIRGVREGENKDGFSPSDDCNVGALGGSIAQTSGQVNYIGCELIESTVFSDYIGGCLVGITSEHNVFTNCKIDNSHLVLNEMNKIGLTRSIVPPKRSEEDVKKIAFGGFAANRPQPSVSGILVSNSNVNMFCARKYLRTDDFVAYPEKNGNSEISDLELKWFPDLQSQYSHSVTIASHIKGQTNTRKFNGFDLTYGLFIDATEKLYLRESENEPYETTVSKKKTVTQTFDNEYDYVLRGGENPITPLQLYTISTEKKSNDEIAIGIVVNGAKENGEYTANPVKIEHLIIHGKPSINTGVVACGAKDLVFDNVAIYDVEYTFEDWTLSNDNTGFSDGTLKFIECDLRGKTIFGPRTRRQNNSYNYNTKCSYSEVLFDRTVFNVGSGDLSNIVGRLEAYNDAILKGCIFRTDFKIFIPEDVTLTFENCYCGAPALQTELTKNNIKHYLDPDSKGNVIFVASNGVPQDSVACEELLK